MDWLLKAYMPKFWQISKQEKSQKTPNDSFWWEMFNMVGGELDKCLSVWKLQFTREKYFLSAFCITVDRIINCSARSAIVMCLPLSLAQSKTITPALSDQLSFPFDPNNFVSWLFLLVFTIVCLFVCWSTLSLQLPVCRSRQQLILIS